MSEAEVVSPPRLIRQRSFVFFWCARTMSNAAFMMQGVAIGWQIYALTNDPSGISGWWVSCSFFRWCCCPW